MLTCNPINPYSLHQGLRKLVENLSVILFFLSKHCLTERVCPSIFPCIHFWQNHCSREMNSLFPKRSMLKDYLWPEIHPFTCLEPPLSPDMVYWSHKIEILKQGGKGHSHVFPANYWHRPGTRGSQSKRSIWVSDVKIIFIIISLAWIQDIAGGQDLTLTGRICWRSLGCSKVIIIYWDI